ncbi:MAG TPA: hypothetical protein DEG92_05175 [Rikenellaceae bacterium]|nr:hypothetical protein [Rikenellaceae bacterium]
MPAGELNVMINKIIGFIGLTCFWLFFTFLFGSLLHLYSKYIQKLQIQTKNSFIVFGIDIVIVFVISWGLMDIFPEPYPGKSVNANDRHFINIVGYSFILSLPICYLLIRKYFNQSVMRCINLLIVPIFTFLFVVFFLAWLGMEIMFFKTWNIINN